MIGSATGLQLSEGAHMLLQNICNQILYVKIINGSKEAPGRCNQDPQTSRHQIPSCPVNLGLVVSSMLFMKRKQNKMSHRCSIIWIKQITFCLFVERNSTKHRKEIILHMCSIIRIEWRKRSSSVKRDSTKNGKNILSAHSVETTSYGNSPVQLCGAKIPHSGTRRK